MRNSVEAFRKQKQIVLEIFFNKTSLSGAEYLLFDTYVKYDIYHIYTEEPKHFDHLLNYELRLLWPAKFRLFALVWLL